ncbi:MAG: hypothetical protein FWG23_02625 [Eggerthellaceae bacterium]|nr:hypothetical protein [Eggerthellaceae bacterium]
MGAIADYRFFKEHLYELYDEYGASFLAIKDGKIIGSYETFGDALSCTTENNELGTFIIQECVDDPAKLIHHFQGNVSFA